MSFLCLLLPDGLLQLLAGGFSSPLEGTERLLAPVFCDSPSPVPHGHFGWRTSMPEANDVSDDITSPIVGSSDLRSAVAAAQAKVAAKEPGAAQALEQQVESQDVKHNEPSHLAAELEETSPAADSQDEGDMIQVAPADAEQAVPDASSAGDKASPNVEQQADPASAAMASAMGSADPADAHASTEQPACQSADSSGLQDSSQASGEHDEQAMDGDSESLVPIPKALSIEVDSSQISYATIASSDGSATQQPAQDAAPKPAAAAASPFHALASPTRPLEGLQSPELLASTSPGTPAQITLQPEETSTIQAAIHPVRSPSMQEEAEGSCLSPAVTGLEEGSEGLTPASHIAEAAAELDTPADAPADAGKLFLSMRKWLAAAHNSCVISNSGL